MILAILISGILITVTIAWHYWTLTGLLRLMPTSSVRHSHFLRSLGILLLVHIVEILWFAGGFYLGNEILELGNFTEKFEPGFQDYLYYSLVTYSTLGLSEFSTVGHLKVMTGLESLTGFIMITWSASFLYTMFGHQFQKEIRKK